MVQDVVVTKSSVVKIVNLVCNESKDGVMVLLLDIIYLCSCDYAIGEPIYVKKETK
jgi:hypothetical protein